MDLKLTPSGDLDITEGDLFLVDGLEAIKQRCHIRLRTFRGEWFLDQRVGMPWRQEVLGVKPFSPVRVAHRMRQALLGVPGVTDVVSVTPSLDPTTRTLTVTFQAVATLDDRANVFSADFVLA
jgi:hypothetical protein